MQMIAACGFNQRNITIASLSLAVGVGFTAASEQDIWKKKHPNVEFLTAEDLPAALELERTT
jgi:NCS2 family nucleobase:cation symporter-2